MSPETVAARERVVVAWLDGRGAVVRRTGSVPLAHSALGGVGEKIVGEPGGQTLDHADAQLPPWPAREEVRAALGGVRDVRAAPDARRIGAAADAGRAACRTAARSTS